MKAKSVAELMKTLGDVDEAVVVLGQLIIVKCDKRVVVKTIDPVRAAHIEKSQVLLSDPQRYWSLCVSRLSTQLPSMLSQSINLVCQVENPMRFLNKAARSARDYRHLPPSIAVHPHRAGAVTAAAGGRLGYRDLAERAG
jgi:hypothetical protein